MEASTKKIKKTIRIVDLPAIALPIAREEEESYNRIVAEINRRWEKQKQNPNLVNDKLKMAILILEFAKMYSDIKMSMKQMQMEQGKRHDELNKMLAQFESNIDEILLNIES